MKKLFKKLFGRLFCKHERTVCCRTILDDVSPGRYRTHHIWKCEKCGKEFW